MENETPPWVKFVSDEWFQNLVKRYFKIITDLGVDTGKKYTEEQKRAMAHCYYPAYWRMMEQREYDRQLGYQVSEKPTTPAYTTYFIEELGKYMEKEEQVYILCPQCRKPSVIFSVNRKGMYDIDIQECEHMKWFSGKEILYSASEFKKLIEDDENAPTDD